MDFMYVIGEPGVGKSALMTALVGNHHYESSTSPFAHSRFDIGPMYLGAFRSKYPGTDALSLSVQPEVVRFIGGVKPEFVMAEGDRLANDKFFDAVARIGYAMHIYYLYADKDTLEARRTARGSDQAPTWMKGRKTKAARLASSWDALSIKTDKSPEFLTMLMRDPVSMCFRRERA